MGNSASHANNSNQEVLIDCPVLVDLGHGTIRHRKPDEKSTANSKVKTGYFYHARLEDFSENAEIPEDEDYKLKYVFKGPKKAHNRLYYVYGKKLDSQDNGIQRSEYRPAGKGFNWPESYRKANNLYYEITFPQQDDDFADFDDDTLSISTSVSSATPPSKKDNITLKVTFSDSCSSVKERLSLKLLLPSFRIHLLLNKNELGDDEQIGDLRTEEQGSFERFLIQLKLT
ncbi:uncharacterized protein LOC135694645 [Rhopilema esculentum]|uniref:uncharacterized protein LOC135694645 n=1 Tax=Rhopilema esculentum TaxID=499914 RepID=UPI0031E02260